MGEQVADALAQAAIAEVAAGMKVGLGAGRTAARCIRALAERVAETGLDIHCVAASEASERLCRQLNLPMSEFALVERLDLLIDGADEVDPQMRMLKGSGGAMTRERMLAWASDRRIYVVDESKLVRRLGQTHPLPVAVIAFGLASVRAALRSMGLNGVCRRTMDGKLFVTDNGNLVIDVGLDAEANLDEIADLLDSVPGVVDHGLFLTEADEILIETPSGIRRQRREPASP